MRNPALMSAAIYTGIALLVSGIFFAVTMAGDYSWVARIGGSVWLFLLSMIIFMPIVTTFIKRRFKY